MPSSNSHSGSTSVGPFGVPRLPGRGHGPRTRGLARVFTGATGDAWCHGARHAHHLTTHPRTAPHPPVDPRTVLPRRPRRPSPHSARSSARVRHSHPRPSASAWLTELRTSPRTCRVPSHVSAIPAAKAPLCASRPRCSAPSSWRPTRGPASTAGRRRTSAYDRGFGTRIADRALAEQRINDAVIPRRGRAEPEQRTRNWRRRYRFRNGLEGRISQLKRRGLRRTRLRGLAGAQTWIGGITLAHNLQRIAALTQPATQTPPNVSAETPRSDRTPRPLADRVLPGEVAPRTA